MKVLGIRHRVEALRIAGEAFLREMPWVLDAHHGLVQQDSWLHLCESFEDYVAAGRERLALLAEQDRKQRERDRVYAERMQIVTRENRWAEFEALAVTHWPGMRTAMLHGY